MGEAKRRLAYWAVTGGDWGRIGYKSPGRKITAMTWKYGQSGRDALLLTAIVAMFTQIQRLYAPTGG